MPRDKSSSYMPAILEDLESDLAPFHALNNKQRHHRSLLKKFSITAGICVLVVYSACWHYQRSLLIVPNLGIRQGPVEWLPCWEDNQVLCGSFNVPTDYTDPSAGVTTLALSKIPATCSTSERLGSVMTNYGGPGAAGRTMSFTHGKEIFKLIGGRYDLISWDPRGIGRTVPVVKCHSSAQASAIFLANTVLETTFEVPPDPFSPEGKAILVKQQKEALALWQTRAEICGQTMGADALKGMGTTTLIKDMEMLSAALEGEDALINFHGGSYGTVVADYLVNMLPHKIGKVIAHGVANPVLWGTEHYENYHLLRELLLNAEQSYARFLDECFSAGANRCALVEPKDKSGQDIGNRIDKFLAELYDTPLPVLNSSRPGLLRSGMIRARLFETIQSPPDWQITAHDLSQAMHGDGTPFINQVIRPIPPDPGEPAPDGFISAGQADLSRLAVSCADAPPYEAGEKWPTAEGMVDQLLGILQEVTPTFGATVNLLEQHGGCQFWPRSQKPEERFNGPWNSSLANPILVVSNSDDPITPAYAGRQMSSRFGKMARHVVQNGIGHSYLTPPTPCYAAIAKRYFEQGILPDDDETFCDADPADNFPTLKPEKLPLPLPVPDEQGL